MKKYSYAILLSLLFIFSCGKQQGYYTQDVNKLLSGHSQPALADFLEQANPVVTEQDYPPIIVAPIVRDELSHDLVIDIRRKDAYEAGHINGAYNVNPQDLLGFLNKLNVSAYKRVVLVCYSGQTATFYAELLRLLGYKNVYAMAYGMAGWNRDFAGIFKKNISAKYINRISKEDFSPAGKSQLPVIEKGLPLDVLSNRVKEVMALKPSQYLISADKVFEDPSKYFIIDLRKKEHYKVGHIPGAVNIRPNKLLPSLSLKYLPTNKPIVVYCYHGYTSVATTAYLRVLGYDAYSLKFGYHSFMDGILNKRIDFSTAFGTFPYITGSKRIDVKASKAQAVAATAQPVKVAVPVKKKQVGGGCE